MSRSLGDAQEKLTAYIWSEPDVAIHEFGPGEDWTVIVCSDGVSGACLLNVCVCVRYTCLSVIRPSPSHNRDKPSRPDETTHSPLLPNQTHTHIHITNKQTNKQTDLWYFHELGELAAGFFRDQQQGEQRLRVYLSIVGGFG